VKQIINSLFITVCLTVNMSAGGKKNIVPAETPIVPIIPMVYPNPIYIGVGLIQANIQRDPCACMRSQTDIKDHRYGAVFRVGADYNQYIGVEARALKSLGSKAFSITKHYGVYVKPQYHFLDSMNIYALLGYGKTTVVLDNGKIYSENTKNSFAYGLGFEYDFTKEKSKGQYSRAFDNQGEQEGGFGLWLDYQKLFNNVGANNLNSSIITMGITYDF